MSSIRRMRGFFLRRSSSTPSTFQNAPSVASTFFVSIAGVSPKPTLIDFTRFGSMPASLTIVLRYASW